MSNSLEFVKTHPDAKLPTKNHATDTGYDVYSVEDKIVPARGNAVVDVGLQFANIPDGYWVRVESRSGMAFKHSINANNGIIDNLYRGNAGIKLYNHSDVDYQVTKGDRIAQFVLYPLVHVEDVRFGEVQETARGEKGFGSSGK